MLDGVTTSLAANQIGVGAPVVISAAGPVGPRPESHYLSGTLDEHLSVSRTFIPAPGSPLIIAKGLSVQPGGALLLNEASGGFASNEIRIEDQISGNYGGSIVTGPLGVGVTSAGGFFQASGTSRAVTLNAGVSPGSTGTIHITGGALLAAAAVIGKRGSGAVEHTSGAATFGNLTLGAEQGSSGSYDISSGLLTVSGSIRIGPMGSGIFRQGGGTSELSTLFVGGPESASNARIEVNRGTLNAAKILIRANGALGQSGGVINSSGIGVEGSAAAPATFTMDGGELKTASLFALGNGRVVLSNGRVTVSGSIGTDINDPTQLGIELRGAHVSANVLALGSVDNPLPARSRLIHTKERATVNHLHVFGSGRYQLAGGELFVFKSAEISGELDFLGSTSRLNVGAGALADFREASILNASNATLTGDANSLIMFPAHSKPLEIFGALRSSGLIQVAGNPLAIPAGQSIGGSGSISGDVTNAGTITPGHSPGTLLIEGSYTQTPTGTLLVEIARTSSDLFDTLSSTGSLTLAGNLKLALLGDFKPAFDDAFTILQGSSLTGRFASAQNQLSFAAGTFDIVYTPNSVTLTHFTPVPEPTALLGAVAVAGGLLRRRRIGR